MYDERTEPIHNERQSPHKVPTPKHVPRALTQNIPFPSHGNSVKESRSFAQPTQRLVLNLVDKHAAKPGLRILVAQQVGLGWDLGFVAPTEP